MFNLKINYYFAGRPWYPDYHKIPWDHWIGGASQFENESLFDFLFVVFLLFDFRTKVEWSFAIFFDENDQNNEQKQTMKDQQQIQ